MKDTTDEEHADLIRKLEKIHRRLERHQREHLRLTGKRWVPEIRLDSAPEKLLNEWLDDESGYDEEAWPELKANLEVKPKYRSASDDETWPVPGAPFDED